ncbi:Flagellar biosynthesis protein FlhF [hydrothermal vent metagenome]|uniref:Flagellar biosynthesis protein FlhF n=1 Tax=hydrothermal vent metagenome TaxID=652676 RepID=A0A3B1ADH4_9ZZZZ
MKIKRFFAKDMRTGIRQVREALGADAVILSNQKVVGGIEIVAAIDYDEALLATEESATRNSLLDTGSTQDALASGPVAGLLSEDTISLSHPAGGRQAYAVPAESPRDSEIPCPEIPAEPPPRKAATPSARPEPVVEWSQDPILQQMKNELKDLRGLLEQQLSSLAWSDLSHRNPLQAKLIRCLLELGLSPALCQQVADEVGGGHDDFDNVWRHALAWLASRVPLDTADSLDGGGVVALVGATGVGKTTTIAKLAARYALRHGRDKVALITTDGYRIAAHEQLRTYGRILNIPVRIANTREELTEALKLLVDKELILIDTAGMSQRDVRLSEQFSMITGSAPIIRTYLVLSTNTHRAGLREIVKAFKAVRLDGCILTKMDETTSLGGTLSTVMENKLPVAYMSDGQRVPEDIHIARAHTLVNRAVLVAQQTSQALEQESLNLAFSGMVANAHG